MAGEVEQVPVSDIENLILKIPMVLKCHVTINDWGGVEEIHALSTVERAPKQIVRDIESALLSQWNLRVDHKRISIAQIVPDAPSQNLGRLIIGEYFMDWDTANQMGHATVTLHPGNNIMEEYEGEWQGRYIPSQYHHVMAQATIEAINNVPGITHRFVLAELRTLALASRSVVVVGLSFLNRRRREEVLIGAAQERGDGQGAAIRAVLDAINRRISGNDTPTLESILANASSRDHRSQESEAD